MVNSIRIMVILFLFINSGIQAQENMLCQGAFWSEDEANTFLKKQSDAIKTLADWEKRASAIRQGLIQGMQLTKMPEGRKEFSAIIRNTREMDGYIVENIAIESFPGFYITGNLYRPAVSGKKFPGIVTPHGHWPDRRMSDEVQIRSACFARMGAVVFVYDMVGYGESNQVSHNIPIALLLQTYNSRRVIDYLVTRSDVDPDRIGITGESGGGTQTIIATALDERIKVSVPVVMVSAYFFGGCVCESGMPIHRSKNHQTNNVEIVALCAPRPMLLVSVGGDWTKNTPVVEFPYIQTIYNRYNAISKVHNVHLPGERHDYGASKRAAVYNFFQHYLGMDGGKLPYNDGFDESFVKILPKAALCVFNENQPWPENALQGDEAVMKYLGLAVKKVQ